MLTGDVVFLRITSDGEHIVNIVGTETGGNDLSRYSGGFLSIDIKNDRVIPCGKEPV